MFLLDVQVTSVIAESTLLEAARMVRGHAANLRGPSVDVVHTGLAEGKKPTLHLYDNDLREKSIKPPWRSGP